MADQDNIDRASEQIAELVDKARAELVESLYTIGKNVEDVNAFIDTLIAMDIEGTLKSKLQKATSIYANAHRNVLETTIGFAEIDGKGLSTFIKLNEELFDSAITKTIAGNIKTQVSQGLKSGLTARQIVESVASTSISKAQMETVVNTTLNTYSRMVTNEMMEVAPDNTKYVYIGPYDDRTRSECIDMIRAGGITKQQIKSRFSKYGDILSRGGGFNCRHKWEIASSEGMGFNEKDKADRLADA